MDISLRKFLIVLLLWLLPGAVVASGQQSILILGDSISSAYGIDKEQGWVALLQQRLDSGYPCLLYTSPSPRDLN